MIHKHNTNRPSKTALMAALHRSLANKEYGREIFGPDYMAIRFLPSHFRFLSRDPEEPMSTRLGK